MSKKFLKFDSHPEALDWLQEANTYFGYPNSETKTNSYSEILSHPAEDTYMILVCDKSYSLITTDKISSLFDMKQAVIDDWYTSPEDK